MLLIGGIRGVLLLVEGVPREGHCRILIVGGTGAPSMIMAQVARWSAIWFCRRRLLCFPGLRPLLPLYTRDLRGKGKARGEHLWPTCGKRLQARENRLRCVGSRRRGT
jgi:hypothetical protein